MSEDGAGVEAFLRGEDKLSSSSYRFLMAWKLKQIIMRRYE